MHNLILINQLKNLIGGTVEGVVVMQDESWCPQGEEYLGLRIKLPNGKIKEVIFITDDCEKYPATAEVLSLGIRF